MHPYKYPAGTFKKGSLPIHESAFNRHYPMDSGDVEEKIGRTREGRAKEQKELDNLLPAGLFVFLAYAHNWP